MSACRRPGEVRLRVHAFGLTRGDAMFRAGRYLEHPILPARIGQEAAGTVEAIGEGVAGFAIGDKVSTMPGFSMNRYGVYGEQTIIPAAMTVRHPNSLSWEHAAAIWMPYMTAYGALVDTALLAPGDAVIITAASSSVGLSAIQIVNAAGAVSIATTRTSAKRGALLSHGAHHVIATEEQNLVEEVKPITGGKGADCLRSGRRRGGGNTGGGGGSGRDHHPIRCARFVTDALPAVPCGRERVELTWLRAAQAGWQPGANGEGEAVCAGRA
jgi:NADPH:quinone reductase